MLDLNKEKLFFHDRRSLAFERPVVQMVSNGSYERTSLGVPDFYNPESKHVGGVQIDSSHQSYPTFSVSTVNSQTGVLSAAQTGNDHQNYIPDDKVLVEGSTGNMSACHISSHMSSLSHGVGMMTTTNPLLSPLQSSLHSSQQLDEKATCKRELRLLKNREAARECRRKKKEYVTCLENRVAMLENQNKKLLEELNTLKRLVAAKECRQRKKQYLLCLEQRLSMLEVQNKKLMDELEYMKEICSRKSS